MTWKRFPSHWLCVRRLTGWPVDSPHNRPLMLIFDISFHLSLHKALHKQYNVWWFVMPLCLCDIIVMCRWLCHYGTGSIMISFHNLIYPPPRLQWSWKGYMVSPCPSVCPFLCPSVHMRTESCPLCTFNNTWWIHSIFTHLSSKFKRFVLCIF